MAPDWEKGVETWSRGAGGAWGVGTAGRRDGSDGDGGGGGGGCLTNLGERVKQVHGLILLGLLLVTRHDGGRRISQQALLRLFEQE